MVDQSLVQQEYTLLKLLKYRETTGISNKELAKDISQRTGQNFTTTDVTRTRQALEVLRKGDRDTSLGGKKFSALQNYIDIVTKESHELRHFCVYSDPKAINLKSGTYFLKRYSFLQIGEISVSRFVLKRDLYRDSKYHYQWNYSEYKEGENQGVYFKTESIGHVHKQQGNYLLVGSGVYKSYDSESANEPIEVNNFIDTLYIHDDGLAANIRGLKIGALRGAHANGCPCVAAFYLESAGKLLAQDDSQLGVREATKEEKKLLISAHKNLHVFLPIVYPVS